MGATATGPVEAYATSLTPGTGFSPPNDEGRINREDVPITGQEAESKTPVKVQQSPKVTVQILSEFPDAIPAKLAFGGLRDEQLRLKGAVPLEVSTDQSHVVVTWAEIDEFGYGTSLGAALDDFGLALTELFYHLDGSQKLGPDLLNVKRILNEYIERRPRR